jgi:hypothetical protein
MPNKLIVVIVQLYIFIHISAIFPLISALYLIIDVTADDGVSRRLPGQVYMCPL